MATLNRKRLHSFSSVKQVVSPERFLKIAEKSPDSIKSSTFIPPRLGRKNDFGKIVIEYNHASKR